MAEEINTPNSNVDAESAKSEFIAPAQIGVNEYKPLVTPLIDIHKLPGKAEVSNPALRIKDTTTGSAPYHPKSTSSGTTAKYDGLDGMFNKAKARLNANVDNNAYSKIYGYDASSKGAHKARYKAYGQETYDKIGFSPEIDNETWFNQNTTMYDDWKRMATHAAWPMLKLGFMSPINSYGKLFGGADIGQDLAEAQAYEEFNAIGYSTKGGIGGFAINLQNSAAYSVGILAESVIEGALIGAAVGFAEGGVGAIPGAAIGGIAEGFEALVKLPGSLINMSKNLGKMSMNLKKFQNLSEVKNLFSNSARSMGDFINPFSNTKEAAMKYVFDNPDDLTNLARTARTAGAMWHDVKNINAALSEGRLEGGFTEQRVFDDLYNKYYDKNGVAPTDDLQKSMRKQAKVAGFQNTWKNTLLVHYSNNIAFPSITKAGFVKGLPTFSKTMGNIGPYQVIFDPSKKVVQDMYRYEQISLRNAAKALVKPATYGKTALNYFKANLVEGFQETAQDVLSDATENYYINSFQNKDRQNFDYSMATLSSAIKKQISKQGLETFASGFAMGSILGIPGGVKEYLSVGYNKYFKHRTNYDEYIKEREDSVKEIVDSLNTMDQNAKYFFDPRMNNYSNQMLVGKVADDPEGHTTKESKDASFAGFQSAVRTSLRTGTFDMFIKNFEGYKQASPEDIEQAWRLEPGQGQKALDFIDTAIGNAKNMASRWQYAKKKFQHVIDPNKFKENTPEREIAEIYNQAYLTGLDNLVFMGSAFDNNTERLSKMYGKLSSLPTIQDSRFSDIASITDPARLQKEIAMLRTEVEAGKTSTTPEGKEQYQKQKDILDKLENFNFHQAVATVQFLKQINTKQAEIMKSKQGISSNEARNLAYEELVAEHESRGENPFENYKQSFTDLLQSIAGSEENKVKLSNEIDSAGGIDNMFEMLMDTYLLKNENIHLNKYIALLNSPKDFYEHVQRNFEWMKKLYDNRQTYYEDVVKNSITAIQRNTLLEELAEQGIYVDLEEFAEWCQDKSKLPSHFIDQTNKRIINKDSYIYDKYIEYFELAKDAEDINPIVPKSEEDTKLQRTIDNYNSQRNGELETVKNQYDKSLKELLGFTEEEIVKMRNEAIGDQEISSEEASQLIPLVEKAIKQLDSDNALEVLAVFEFAAEQEMFTVQEYNMAKEELFSNEDALREAAELSERFVNDTEEDGIDAAANAYILKPLLEKKLEQLKTISQGTGLEGIPEYETTQPYADYQTAVKEINDKYEKLINDAIAASEEAARADLDAKRPEAMKKAIQEVQDMLAGKEDIVQTKRNYIVDGEPHERMSNVIKTGYDTYGYSGEEGLLEVFDKTIGAALNGEGVITNNTISNGDNIISVENKPLSDEIKSSEGEYFITEDNDPEGRIYINPEPLKDILVIPNNQLRIVDKKDNKTIITKNLNDEGSVIFEAMQGRLFVVANINGQLVPFYKSSSGTDGKKQGDWYPFFGYTGSWLVKGGIDKATGKMSYSSEIDRVTNLLNENLVFPDKYISRATNSIKTQDGEVVVDFNDFFKVNRLWQKVEDISTGTKANYRIDGLKENTRSESGAVALITGLNTTVLDSSGSPMELAEWFNLINNNIKAGATQRTKTKASTNQKANLEKEKEEALQKIKYKYDPFNPTEAPKIFWDSKGNKYELVGEATDYGRKQGIKINDGKVRYINPNRGATGSTALYLAPLREYIADPKPIIDRYEEQVALGEVEETVEPRTLDQDLINQFIKELEEADLPGINTNVYTLDIIKDELETLVAPKGTRLSKKTQKNVDKLKAQISKINAKLDATKDKARIELLNRQKAELESTLKDEEAGKFQTEIEMTPDNLKSFILNTVKENAFEESRDAGNIIDPMLRDYLDTATSKKPAYDPKKMSREAYDALFDDETGYLTQLKKMADAGDIYIFTKDLFVHANDLVDAEGNKLPPVAGEIDMIIVDKTGKKHIVDLKTGKITKWLNYKTVGTQSYKKQLENTMQQTGYANLVENMTGDQFDIMIFPLEVEFDKKGFIVRAGKPTNPSIFAGEELLGGEGTQPFTIKLDKGNTIQVKNEETGAYQNMSIDEFMQKLVPVKGKTPASVKTQPKKENVIPENERAAVDEFMYRMANAGRVDTDILGEEDIDEDKEFDDLVELGHQLDKMKPTLSAESYNMLRDQLNVRMSLAFDKTGNIVLKPGEIYIFTEPVKANKVPEGYRVKIDSFDPKEGTVTVSRVGPGRPRAPFTMNIDDFNKVAMSEEDINNLPKEPEQYTPTQEEIELLTQSMETTNGELSDFEQLAKWEDEASDDSISLDDLKNDFFNNIKC